MLNVSEPLVPHGAAHFPVSSPADTRNFAFLLLPEFTLLAFSSAIDPLRISNQLSQRPLYRWTILSEDGRPVSSSCGVSVNVDGSLQQMGRDTVLLVCSGNLTGRQASSTTLDLVKRHYLFGGKVGAICTGAVTLARSGLLDGKSFTLHWENQPSFVEQFPRLRPSAQRFEIDGRILTCGGGAASADLALKIISDDYGIEFATVVSDMCLRRADTGTEQMQRTSLGSVLQTRNPRLIAIVRLMHENVASPISKKELAKKVGYSERHIERLFLRCLGMSPSQYYRNIRLDHARSLLAETEMSLFEVAAACGFDKKAYFAKAFKSRFGCPPSRINYHNNHAANTEVAICRKRAAL